jgi:GNAT superfamily N-acetyltransferase
MAEPKMRIRRGRRTDFTAVMKLLADSGSAVPPPDRATLRRFRNIVADLGADFYLASIDDALAGLVHVTYARQLIAGPRARLDQLLVAEEFRRRGVGSALLAFVAVRARKRGCSTFSCTVPATSPRAFLEAAGFRAMGSEFCQDLQVDSADG